MDLRTHIQKKKRHAKSLSRTKKFARVMGEFKGKKLKSSSGTGVTDPKQAVAIAYSEAARKKRRGY